MAEQGAVEFIRGVARIGRSGAKLHPAVKYVNGGWVQPICGCPGTSNNHASVSGFWTDVPATCGRNK